MATLEGALHTAATQLRGTDNDTKVASLDALKERLRAYGSSSSNNGDDEGGPGEVTTPVLSSVVEQLKVALKSSNARVSASALACTDAFFHALGTLTDAAAAPLLKTAVGALLPAPGVMAYLGDSKEATRSLAGSALLQAGKAAAAADQSASGESTLNALDALVKEHGFGSKNARAREQSLRYLAAMRVAAPAAPLRLWVPLLVATLEDSDGTVRDVARETVIAIFTMPTVGPAAKADLKKEMMKKGVRKGTSEAVLKGVLGGGGTAAVSMTPSSTSSVDDHDRSSSRGTATSGQSASSNSNGNGASATSPSRPASISVRQASSRGEKLLKQPKNMSQEDILAAIEAQAAAAAPPPRNDNPDAASVQVVYIASQRDLEHEFRAFVPHFEGKETEFNWQDREKAIFRMRGMLRGGVDKQYIDAFVSGLRGAAEDIIKALNSLRTTLASSTCSLLAELAEQLAHHLDPLYETFTSNLLKLASLTKKTIAQQSQDALSAFIKHCPYHAKLLSVLLVNLDQKNVQARVYTAGHIRTFLEAQAAPHRQTIESSGGLEILQQSVKRSLADANANVRDHARATFWLLQGIWPTAGASLLESLDAGTRKLVEKANPRNSAGTGTRTVSASSQTSTAGRPSVRSLISARRAAQSSGESNESARGTNGHSEAGHTGPSTSSEREPMSTPIARRTAVSLTSIGNGTPQSRPSVSPPASRPQSIYARTVSSPAGTPPVPRASPLGRTPVQPPARSASSRSLQRDGSLLPRTSPMKTPAGQSGRIASGNAPATAQPPSPTLFAMAHQNNDFSTFEGYTLELANTVPLPHESSSEEEDGGKYDVTRRKVSPVRQHPRRATGTTDESRILDHLLDASFTGNDSQEVEEAVKGRAEQAEQTAHRFLELVEPEDDSTGSTGDQTVLHDSHTPDTSVVMPADGSNDSGISVEHIRDVEGNGGGVEGRAGANATTPLLKRLQELHLKDSPAAAAGSPRRMRPSDAANSWWMTKAELDVRKAIPLPDGEETASQALLLAAALETHTIDGGDLLRLARLSSDRPYVDGDQEDPLWMQERLYVRLMDGVCSLLASAAEDKLEPALVLATNLIAHQGSLLGGREAGILGLMLDLRRRENKGISAAAQVVMQLFIDRTDPLYGLASLKISLEAHLKTHSQGATIDERTAQSYAMALRSFGSLFVELPSAVLEEELERVAGLIKGALDNPSYPHLRQAAIACISKAHTVLEDDPKVFAILGGLSKAQINLCTYFFARERPNNA